jgi:hypothetical protein
MYMKGIRAIVVDLPGQRTGYPPGGFDTPLRGYSTTGG